jgi:hypothetical protein
VFDRSGGLETGRLLLFRRSTDARGVSSCRLQVAIVATLVLLALLASVTIAWAGSSKKPSPKPKPSVPTSILGVYRGGGKTSDIREYERWLGRPLKWALDSEAQQKWDYISTPDWQLKLWAKTKYRLVLGVPLIPETGGTLAAGAAGEYNVYFEKLARRLLHYKLGDTVLRLGWEFNGWWYRWNAAVSPTMFVAYWRQVVTTMRRIAPGLKFDWCPALGFHQFPTEQAWPGDAYVDFVGSDVYDHWYELGGRIVNDPEERWTLLKTQPYGLDWLAKFAAEHKKRITIPEWGVITHADGRGGGDNPVFIRRMHTWILQKRVAYAMYFHFDAPDAPSRLTPERYPNATKTFKKLFGP